MDATPDTVFIRPFQAGDEHAFRALNEAWIAAIFTIEAKDREVLEHPVEKILTPGGHILMAVSGGRAVGCGALLAMPDGGFEVAKMAVDESLRGRGIGRMVLVALIDHSRNLGAPRLFLETNHQLANAIHLYESCGFVHMPPDRVKPSPYVRSDVSMEMLLPSGEALLR
ncbi:GNAT family N-acetyltransferase [Paludibaculum fermentans]|uniref:GNAT family N-acetyltransferase n=1 Tax=Paludibaculum fermentans TaxID=1473598 RepID=A0A7S7SK61_PALFE|nr:GNAT family N-acetyltransferase [Paludibaculum fermentans]QOY86680.1 GNAT family N-acetyltransferase [Paludibaculum fermentans]